MNELDVIRIIGGLGFGLACYVLGRMDGYQSRKNERHGPQHGEGQK